MVWRWLSRKPMQFRLLHTLHWSAVTQVMHRMWLDTWKCTSLQSGTQFFKIYPQSNKRWPLPFSDLQWRRRPTCDSPRVRRADGALRGSWVKDTQPCKPGSYISCRRLIVVNKNLHEKSFFFCFLRWDLANRLSIVPHINKSPVCVIRTSCLSGSSSRPRRRWICRSRWFQRRWRSLLRWHKSAGISKKEKRLKVLWSASQQASLDAPRLWLMITPGRTVIS